jgi:hypothetical protein
MEPRCSSHDFQSHTRSRLWLKKKEARKKKTSRKARRKKLVEERLIELAESLARNPVFWDLVKQLLQTALSHKTS